MPFLLLPLSWLFGQVLCGYIFHLYLLIRCVHTHTHTEIYGIWYNITYFLKIDRYILNLCIPFLHMQRIFRTYSYPFCLSPTCVYPKMDISFKCITMDCIDRHSWVNRVWQYPHNIGLDKCWVVLWFCLYVAPYQVFEDFQKNWQVSSKNQQCRVGS